MSRAETTTQRTGCRILIAGTGGQGVITTARLLVDFFVSHEHQVQSSQLHGMAQRGGAVQSAVLVDTGISPVIGRGGADIVLGLEPIETARALPLITARTAVLLNPLPIAPYVLAQNAVFEEGPTEYPSIEKLCAEIQSVTNSLAIVDASTLAKQAGSIRAINVVLLGCLFGSGLLPYNAQSFLESTMKTVPAHLAEVNTRAFLAGAEHGGTLDLIEVGSCL